MLTPVAAKTITPTRDLTIDYAAPAPLSFAGVASDCAAESKRNDGQASTSAANGQAVSLGIHREQLSQTQSDYLELRNQRMDTNRRLLIANARAKAGKAAYVNNVKATSPEWIRPHRVGRCQTRASSAVGVYRTKTSHGDYTHFSGIETCGSPWACPNCSAKARRALAEKLNEAFITITKSKSGLNAGLFMTLTLRHNKNIPLKTSLATLQKAYESMRRTSRWKNLMKRLGHVGIVRTTEITYSMSLAS